MPWLKPITSTILRRSRIVCTTAVSDLPRAPGTPCIAGSEPTDSGASDAEGKRLGDAGQLPTGIAVKKRVSAAWAHPLRSLPITECPV